MTTPLKTVREALAAVSKKIAKHESVGCTELSALNGAITALTEAEAEMKRLREAVVNLTSSPIVSGMSAAIRNRGERDGVGDPYAQAIAAVKGEKE